MKFAYIILTRAADLLLLLQEVAEGDGAAAAPAQPAQGADAPPAGAAGGIGQLLPMMVVAAVMFYFIVLRPQQAQRREREEKLNELKKNDKVVTIGGIIGTITGMSNDGKRVTLRVDDGTRIEFTRGSIHGLYDDKPDAESEEKK